MVNYLTLEDEAASAGTVLWDYSGPTPEGCCPCRERAASSQLLQGFPPGGGGRGPSSRCSRSATEIPSAIRPTHLRPV